MNRALLGLAVLAASVSAQQAGKQASSPAKAPVRSETAAATVAQLEKQIAELEKEVKDLKVGQEWLQNYAIEQISSLQHATATFDPSSPGPYQLIDSSIGPVLVSLGKAEQYLDGYNVQLEVGNITAAALQGFKVSAKWAKRYKKEDGDYFTWLKSRKSKEYGFTGTLSSGKWNTFQIILPDTKPSEFGYLELSIETNTVSMTKTAVAQ